VPRLLEQHFLADDAIAVAKQLLEHGKLARLEIDGAADRRRPAISAPNSTMPRSWPGAAKSRKQSRGWTRRDPAATSPWIITRARR
jgi:hypothetical protein